MPKSLFVIAGELSGDAHGAGLLASLRSHFPDLLIAGAGGPQMRELAGVGLRDWVEDAAVMGVWEVLKHYSWFRRQFQELLDEAIAQQPDVLLLIDYPGFNLRFARAIRKKIPQIKIVYYISPQVWAWNRGRIPMMARVLDEMMCLFPFEQEIFSSAGLPTTFVGHPLVDELEQVKSTGLRAENLVGLFPGSREREVHRLFPLMLDAAKQIKNQRPEISFEAPAASARLAATMRAMVLERNMDSWVHVTDGASHELMQRATCGVIASGTATLEAAYFGLPYLLVYRVAWPTYWLGRMLIKIDFIGLVNILAKKSVVRELIQSDANATAVALEIRDFLDHPAKREELTHELHQTASLLGGSGAHRRAAEVVADWLRGDRKKSLSGVAKSGKLS